MMLSWLVLAAVLGGASDVPRSLPAGSRVRVTTAPERTAASVPSDQAPVKGRLLEVQVDSLTVQTSAGRLVIPFERVARLEVSKRGRNLKRGVLIGGLVGFAALSALMVATFDEGDDISLSTGESFAIGAILGAPTGAAIGLGIGAVVPPWHSVAVPRAAESRQTIGTPVAHDTILISGVGRTAEDGSNATQALHHAGGWRGVGTTRAARQC